MKRIRVEYRFTVKSQDGSEHNGRTVYRRTTAAQRLLDYAKDGLAARYEVWSNENPAGEWQHLASQDRQNAVTAQGQPLRKRAAGQTFDYDPSNEAAHIPADRCQSCARKRPLDARGFCKSCRHGSVAEQSLQTLTEKVLEGSGPASVKSLLGAVSKLSAGSPKVVLTPRGKRLSPKQYASLVRAQQVHDAASPCRHGHDSCAAWYGGPCSDELAGLKEDA